MLLSHPQDSICCKYKKQMTPIHLATALGFQDVFEHLAVRGQISIFQMALDRSPFTMQQALVKSHFDNCSPMREAR